MTTGASRESSDPSDPLAEGDPFGLLGVEPAFDIDLDGMRRRVRRRVAALHPDRFTDPVEIDQATRETARLNAAWKLIEDEETRANLLLVRFGGPSAEEDRSLPPEFLQEILSIRMELEEAIESDDQPELQRLTDWADHRRSELRHRIREALGEFKQGRGDPKGIRLDLNVWRYLQRMWDELGGSIGAGGAGA